MGMTAISMDQLLNLWIKLEDAYTGNASHGSVAEVYAYTLMPYSPSYTHTTIAIFDESRLELEKDAGTALVEVVERFQKLRLCKVTIDGLEPRQWLADVKFCHRAHVAVVKPE
jgi:hypothetical protein